MAFRSVPEDVAGTDRQSSTRLGLWARVPWVPGTFGWGRSARREGRPPRPQMTGTGNTLGSPGVSSVQVYSA